MKTENRMKNVRFVVDNEVGALFHIRVVIVGGSIATPSANSFVAQ